MGSSCDCFTVNTRYFIYLRCTRFAASCLATADLSGAKSSKSTAGVSHWKVLVRCSVFIQLHSSQ